MTSRRTFGPEVNYERAGADLYRETRTGFVRLHDFLKSSGSAAVLAMAVVAVAAEPGTMDAVLPLSALFAGWVLTRRVVLPLRLPITAARRDHNYPHPKNRRPRMAAGILYVGRDYRTGQELWISNEDGRQHVAVPGTTGAGKTVALVSLCANALSWGSGFIFVDGKADNRLYADVLALARKYGREDDVLVLNFLVASGAKHSHTFNPFAWGNADVIRELLVSQIESNPGGDKGGNHVFMQRAVALMGALTPVLVWMRDHKGVPIDIEGIRFATELESIVSLAKDRVFRRRDTATGVITEMPVPDIDEALLYPLRSYLGESGGYDLSQPVHKQRSDEPAKQHSFVVMHFSATFTQLAVSLGHIFRCEIGDIDMRDVVLNRRILVVNLPALENSGETTHALGKLVVASLRNMMAQTLGADLEGDYAEVIENKAHTAPTPFPVVFDEAGYYLPAGADKMLAMGRGLGFMFYLGFQELPGLKARVGDAVYSLLGNANFQILMRLQEGSETRKYVEQTVGDTHVTQASSFSANEYGVLRESMNADIRQTYRVNWNDLRSLIEGEAIVVFGKERVYAKLFHAEANDRGPLRMNRPLALRPPAPGEIRHSQERVVRIARHLAAGHAARALSPAGSPTLNAVLLHIAQGLKAPEPPPLAELVGAAILSLKDVQADAPVPVSAAAAGDEPDQDAEDTPYTPMLEGVTKPLGSDQPAPEVPKESAAPEFAQAVAAIEMAMGSSPAEARISTDRTAAIREAGLRQGELPRLPPLSSAELRARVEALTVLVEGVARRPAPGLLAAE